MKSLNNIRFVLSILLVSLIGYGLAIAISEHRLLSQISSDLRPSVEASLTAYLFGEKDGQGKDRFAIEGLIKKVNEILHKERPPSKPWLPVQVNAIRLFSVSEIQSRNNPAVERFGHTREIAFEVLRGEKPRTVVVHVRFSPNIIWIFAWLLLVALTFLVIAKLTPSQLSGFQKEVYQLLNSKNISDRDAIVIARSLDPERVFTDLQMALLEHLLEQLGEPGFSMEEIVEALKYTDDDLLKGKRGKWLYLGLEVGLGPRQSIDLAAKDDAVEYDTKTGELKIRGLPIEMSKAPLLYYLWYLEKRLQGEGWVTNPRSGKHRELALGKELEDCFERYGGDRRSLKRLQDAKGEMLGVTADILRDMRSKIKKAITTVITDIELASPYLVENSRPSVKNPGGKDFRVALSPRYIHIHTGLHDNLS